MGWNYCALHMVLHAKGVSTPEQAHLLRAGLSTFSEWLQERDVAVFSGNKGAENATKRGKHLAAAKHHAAYVCCRRRKILRSCVPCAQPLDEAGQASMPGLGRAGADKG